MKNKKLIRRLVIIGIIILLLIFVIVQIVNLVSPGIATETAVRASVTDSLRVEGLIVRKETVLKNTTSGVISYEVGDGTKVAKNGVIASTYADSEAAATESRKMELKEELEQLQDLNTLAGASAINPDNVNKQIYQRLYSMKTNINEFNLSDIQSDRNSVLNLMNQWQLATGKITTFNDRITELKTEIAGLNSSSGKATGSIRATSAGYFVKSVDGYETVYDYNKITQMTVEEFHEAKEATAVDENVIGKVCEQFEWYIVCEIPADTAMKLGVGDEIDVKLPFASSMNIPAKIVAINQTNIEEPAALVLECSYMDPTLATIRNETVLLNIDTYDGIRISQNAIRFEEVTGEVIDSSGSEMSQTKEVRGVYVVDGSELKFVQIVPLYTTGNYVICDPDPAEGELLTDETIELYDTIALGGNLYDGKTVG